MRTEHDIKYCMTGGFPNEIIIRHQEERMNDKLKKKKAETINICFSLNAEDDADIIRWISHQKNKSKAIRKLIKAEANKSEWAKEMSI